MGLALNPGLQYLEPYPFERLAVLRQDIAAPAALTPINLSIGEPQDPTPPFIHDALRTALAGTAKYPATRGTDETRAAMAAWLCHRFGLPPDAVDPTRMVLPVNGLREALFAIAQTLVPRTQARRHVLMPNPFYQIYEGAALLAGALPYYMPCPAERGFLPDPTAIPHEVLSSCALIYLCTPSNPAGSVMSRRALQELLELADRHDFVVVSDECYSELYFDEAAPPPGLLEAAWHAGRPDFRRCLVMHSLSKRSNVPGLRAGFVAGDPSLVEAFLRYRTYHGAAMPLHVQAASVAAWGDETHVRENRARYRARFRAVTAILGRHLPVVIPAGGFYLWLQVPLDDREMCRRLIAQANVTTLPGQFLARTVDGHNPGAGRLRLALVADEAQCVEAARRIGRVIESL